MGEGLLYKLRMMGIRVSLPIHVRCDNQSVVYNTQRPESQLKKKMHGLCFHYVRERCASGLFEVSHESTDSNLADVLTKILVGEKQNEMNRKILY